MLVWRYLHEEEPQKGNILERQPSPTSALSIDDEQRKKIKFSPRITPLKHILI